MFVYLLKLFQGSMGVFEVIPRPLTQVNPIGALELELRAVARPSVPKEVFLAAACIHRENLHQTQQVMLIFVWSGCVLPYYL